MDLGRRVTVIAQEVQEGFGHAVFLREGMGQR